MTYKSPTDSKHCLDNSRQIKLKILKLQTRYSIDLTRRSEVIEIEEQIPDYSNQFIRSALDRLGSFKFETELNDGVKVIYRKPVRMEN